MSVEEDEMQVESVPLGVKITSQLDYLRVHRDGSELGSLPESEDRGIWSGTQCHVRAFGIYFSALSIFPCSLNARHDCGAILRATVCM